MGIDVADAEAGKVKHMPEVQGVVPADMNSILSSPSSGMPEDQQAAPPATQPETPPAQQPNAPPQENAQPQ